MRIMVRLFFIKYFEYVCSIDRCMCDVDRCTWSEHSYCWLQQISFFPCSSWSLFLYCVSFVLCKHTKQLQFPLLKGFAFFMLMEELKLGEMLPPCSRNV